MTSIEKEGLTFTADVSAYNETDPKKFKFEVDCGLAGKKDVTSSTKNGSQLATVSHKYDWNPESCEFFSGNHKVSLFHDTKGKLQEQCSEIYPVKTVACTIQFKIGNVDLGSLPQIGPNKSITVSVPRTQRTEERPNFLLLVQRAVMINYTNLNTKQEYSSVGINPNSTVQYEHTFNSSAFSPGYYKAHYSESSPLDVTRAECESNFYLLNSLQTPFPIPSSGTETGVGPPQGMCDPGTIKDADERLKCNNCKDGLVEFAGNPGSWSALGCIPVEPSKFITWLLNSAINIVGGIAFLLILFGSFKVATSSGNPENLNEGKEIIFAAIAGLLFIILSVVLLKIIGGDILQIPDFG